MRNFFKKLSKRKLLNFWGTLAIVISITIIPFCNWSAKNYYIVSEENAECITNAEIDGLIVTFKCDANDFPELLSKFVQKHKELNLEKIETVHDKGYPQFLVTFSR